MTNPKPEAIEAVADMVGEWLHRMHGVTSSCDHHTEARELLTELRDAIHRDGPDADAIRDALGLRWGQQTRYPLSHGRERRVVGEWCEVQP